MVNKNDLSIEKHLGEMSGVYVFGAIISTPYLLDRCYDYHKRSRFRKEYQFVYLVAGSVCAWPISVPLFMFHNRK